MSFLRCANVLYSPEREDKERRLLLENILTLLILWTLKEGFFFIIKGKESVDQPTALDDLEPLEKH